MGTHKFIGFIHEVPVTAKFPVILIPKAIAKAKPKLSPRPISPQSQFLQRPQPPLPPGSEPQLLSKQTLALYWGLNLFISIAIGIVLAVVSAQVGFLVGLGTLLLCSSLLSLYLWREYSAFAQRKTSYEQQQQEYLLQQKHYAAALANFKERQQQNEAVQASFREEYSQWKRQAEDKQTILLLLLERTWPPSRDRVNRAAKGESEPSFEKYLHQYFPGKIHASVPIQNPAYDCSYTYVLDFAYIDPQTNLSINIEVDEPYSLQTGKPLHYLSNQVESNRERFLTGCCWSVIRFSEEQVVRYPESCCRTIAEVIADIMGYAMIPKEFAGVRSLPFQPRWTYEEATRMAKTDYRQTYLTANY